MIEFTTGNIFEADVDALVNTVNCVGVMGRGLALQFKRAFPANFKAYKDACDADQVKVGEMFVFETGQLTNPRWIINFPTKRHWRSKSRLEDVDAGLFALADEIQSLAIQSIAIPPLGCGLGGLNWPDVRELMEKHLADTDADVVVYEPKGAPPAKEVVKPATTPNWTRGRAVLVALIDRYLAGLLDPEITLLEIHKLVYFAQEAGEPLRLKFEKGHYGPYAENLRHIMKRIDGHFVSGYRDGGDQPDKVISLLPGVREKAAALLQETDENVFHRVADAVDGFETPQNMELLATVLWVAREEGARSPREAVDRVHAWNPRKQMFSERQIGIAFEILRQKGWLPASSA